MKSIEERARELSIIDDDGWCVRDPNIEAACIKIANEVIDKACNTFCRYCQFDCENHPHDDCEILIEYKATLK